MAKHLHDISDIRTFLTNRVADHASPDSESSVSAAIAVADALVARCIPSDVVILGEGEWATAFGWGPFAIKLFRDRSDYNVREVITAEAAMHHRIGTGPRNPLPRLYAERIVPGASEAGSSPAGYLIFDRFSGETLQFQDLLGFPEPLLGEWMDKLVQEERRLEETLAHVDPLPAWGSPGEDTFVPDWVNRIHTRTEAMKAFLPTFVEDRRIATEVAECFRDPIPAQPILLNGGMQPDNTITRFGTDPGGRRIINDVRMIDPMIVRGAWTLPPRWLSLHPHLGELYAETYARQAHVPPDPVSLSAYAVLTHLHNALKYEDPRGTVYRADQAKQCRAALRVWLEKWRAAIAQE